MSCHDDVPHGGVLAKERGRMVRQETGDPTEDQATILAIFFKEATHGLMQTA